MNNYYYRRLINTARWRRLRAAVLAHQPLCQRCLEEGRLTPAAEVHHIIPIEEGLTGTQCTALAYDPANVQALCHDCHVQTHYELGRGGVEARKARQARQLQIIRRTYGL